MNKFDFERIIEKNMVVISNFKNLSIPLIFKNILLYKKKIYVIKIFSNIDNVINVELFELYSKNINKILKKKSNKKTLCVECFKKNPTHVYTNCGHRVHLFCAIMSLNKEKICNFCSSKIDKTKINYKKINTKDDCSICLNKTNNTVDCGHHFHKKCFKEYIKINNKLENPMTCPMCRKEFYNNIPKRRKIIYLDNKLAIENVDNIIFNFLVEDFD